MKNHQKSFLPEMKFCKIGPSTPSAGTLTSSLKKSKWDDKKVVRFDDVDEVAVADDNNDDDDLSVFSPGFSSPK
jgi:hypothetical protein